MMVEREALTGASWSKMPIDAVDKHPALFGFCLLYDMICEVIFGVFT